VGPFETIALVAVLFAGVKIFGPLGAAIGDRLRGARGGSEPDHRLAEEIDQVRTRLAEVEERLDFAERLLAQPQQPARLGAAAEESGR
jgi:hypothetical protein